MRVLVTGASGFIGRFVADALRRKGFAVVGTSRTEMDGAVAADITDPSSFDELWKAGPFDAVVHCAAIAHRSGAVSDDDYHRVNVEGTRNIAQFAGATRASRFIHLSSVLVYGRHGVGIRETDECAPRDAYGISKLVSEGAAMEISRKAGMAITVLRPAPVVGEGCKGNLPRLVRAIDRGYFVNVGDVQARKSMIYVGDVADACVRVLEAKQTCQVATFNLAGEMITTGELLSAVYKALDKNGPTISLPAGPADLVLSGLAKVTKIRALFRAARSLETWISDDVYATDAIAEQIGFSAGVPINEAIRRTVESYRATAAG